MLLIRLNIASLSLRLICLGLDSGFVVYGIGLSLEPSGLVNTPATNLSVLPILMIQRGMTSARLTVTIVLRTC